MGAPNFAESFAKGIMRSAKRRSWLAFVPWWLGLCVATPIVYLRSDSVFVFTDEHVNYIVVLFSSFAVVGAFLGSISISAMVQIQKVASEYPFSDYLRDEDIFDQFIFFPQYILTIQLIFIIYSCLSIMVVFSGIGFPLIKYFIFIGFGLMIYISTKTWGLLDVIRKLMWHYEE